jgi:hypothetical protein
VRHATEHDLAMLQGRWEPIGMEADGVVDPAGDLGPPGAVTTASGEAQREYPASAWLRNARMKTVSISAM